MTTIPQEVPAQPVPPAQPVSQPQFETPTEEYWGVDEQVQWFLPDKKQYFTIKVMDEGDRTKFQKMTNTSLRIDRNQNTEVAVDQARDRHHLIITSVVDWYIFRNGQPVPFSKGSPGSNLEQWLAKAPPKLVDDLEFFIRRSNPWMQAEMSVEAIDEEIDRLYKLRKDLVERESGEGSSANK